MPFVRMPDGTTVEVGSDALFNDEQGTNPFVVPTAAPNENRFSEADLARVRQEEKDKLYTRLESTTEELTTLREQVGTLTAAQQAEQQRLEAEQQRLEAERQQAEEAEMDARTLIERRQKEWDSELQNMRSEWENRLSQEQQAREQEAALRQREQEFNDLQAYTQQVVASNQDKIAPQLLGWISGESREAIDAAVNRAIETTNAIAEDIGQTQAFQPVAPEQQQQNPYGQPQQVQQPGNLPPLPGTRATSGPVGDPSQQYQTLTPDQIRNMPMSEYAKMRSNMGIGGQSQNVGMYG